MNPDYYSDIKLAQRFMLESSIYLLNMFEKKVDSFITNKTRQSRDRDRLELCHERNIIDPDGKIEDPIKALSKDLTKPVWHCITKMQVTAVCVKNEKEGSTPEMVAAMNDIFARFLIRLKHQHQDQSSFRIHLNFVERLNRLEEEKQDIRNRRLDKNWYLLQELLELLAKLRDRYEKDLKDRNESNEFLESYLKWCELIIDEELVYEDSKQRFRDIELQLPAELSLFTSVVCQHMRLVIESAQGPTCINYWPDLHFLPDIIHPMLICIFIIIKDQLTSDRNADKDKDKDKEEKLPLAGSSVSLPTSQSIEEETDCVFEELPQRNCSKITFINFDGDESPFNLSIAKYLCKYLQYISFPYEEGWNVLNQESYCHDFREYSELLVKNYVYSELTEQERQFQHRLFKTKQRTEKELMEYYKRLFVFPIQSLHLSQKYELRSVEFYQTKFIKFVMKELIYIQIKEFNPSIIVISLSNRLHLDQEFFQQLMKELTIIGNMRLFLYNNLTPSFMYQTRLPENMLSSQMCQNYYISKRNYNRKYNQRVAMFKDNDINFPIFDSTARFLKIASGTYTLERAIEEDSVTEKYDVFRVQRYAGTLIKLLGKSHPVLEKFRNRCNEYLRLERMLTGIYESERSAEDTPASFPFYHKELLQYAKKIVASTVGKEGQSFLRFPSRQYFENEWEDFALRFRLTVKKEREEEDYKFITRLKRNKFAEEESDDFIALEFQIEKNDTKYLVNIGKQSQICIQANRQDKTVCVYLFNHLFDHREGILRSYCGEVDTGLEESFQGKVRLQEIEVPFQLQHPFQHLTKFNYLETSRCVLLFWPTLYDEAQALANRFLHAEYEPVITNLIFAASRSAPHRFLQIIPSNSSYKEVLPRCGCTCYLVPQTDVVYIFGGFYANKEDYLNFQTDITQLILGEQLEVSNVPKTFYFDYQQTMPNQTDLPYRITKLKEDFVRPRIEYQVYELKKNEDLESRNIILLGGVGERFLRPYSMIGYMGHFISFKLNGDLQKVRRMKLHNLVPVNLRKSVRAFSSVELPTVSGAQNRLIYSRKVLVPAGTATYSWFSCKYLPDEEKMTYSKLGELAILPEFRQERAENSLIIKENNSQMTAKATLRHYSSLKEVDNKVALVYQYGAPVEQSYSVIFSLQLELAEDIYMQLINLPTRQVPLTSRHLISVDTLGLEVYAVIRHEEYTRGRYILAHCDTSTTVQVMLEGAQRRIILKEIYRFDGDMRHCTLKALLDRRVALVHSFPMHLGAKFPEYVLKRTIRGHYVREQVYNDYSSYTLKTFLEQQTYRSNPVSFYFTARYSVVSWSFLSISRGTGEEEYCFLVEELNCRQERKRWRVKLQKMVKFQKMFVTSQQTTCVTTILDIRVTGERRYEVILLEGDHHLYVGNFDAHTLDTNTVTFREYDKSMEEYCSEKFRQKFNVEYLQKMSKHPSMYEDRQEEMEVEIEGKL